MTMGFISCIFLTKYGVKLKELSKFTDFTEPQSLTLMGRESRGFLLRLRPVEKTGVSEGKQLYYCSASRSYTALFLSWEH